MKKQNITLIFNHFEREHLGKDVFLVPHYLGKLKAMAVRIVCPATNSNADVADEVDDTQVVRLPYEGRLVRFYISRNVIDYLRRHARSIDVLMTFQCTLNTFVMIRLYKLFNPRGKAYIKADGSDFLLRMMRQKRAKHTLCRHLLKSVDVVSIEERSLYERIIAELPCPEKIVYMPNGFDEDRLVGYDITERVFDEKENLFITVGRLGTYPKNTEMLLEAATKLSFGEWKLLLIGPIEKDEQDFEQMIDGFYNDNPHLRDRVVFVGAVYDKKDLWKYYNRAKVFVLTSEREGFPIVYGEAYRFSNYILTTDVGGARDILAYDYGQLINDATDLAVKMQAIIDGKTDLKCLYESHREEKRDLSWPTMLRQVVARL